MEGMPQEKVLSLLNDCVFCIIDGLLLFVLTYPLFLSLTTMSQVISSFGNAFPSYSVSTLILLPVVMPLIVGAANITATRYLWSYNCNSNWRAWMMQGLIIVVITQLLLLPFPTAYAILTSTQLWIAPLLLILFMMDYLILFGLIGKVVARGYIEPRPYRREMVNQKKPTSLVGTRARCPHCLASHKYHDGEIDENGVVNCLTCNRPFYVESISILMNKIGEKEDSNSRIDL
jgi:hypothetical protein